MRLGGPVALHPLQEAHLPEVEDGPGQLQGLAQRDQVLGEEDVGRAAEEHPQVGDVAFAEVVQRRVRDLREVLVEVVEEGPGLGGEDIGPGRVAHGADGLLAGGDHGIEDLLQLLAGAGEEGLAEHADGTFRRGWIGN